MTFIKQIKNKYTGYTIIELLLVLFICSFFLLLPTLSIKNWQQTLSVEQFLSSFEKKLLLIQQLAIVERYDTQFSFSSDEQVFIFVSSNRQERLILPRKLSFTGPKKIRFNKETGNNSQLARLEFRWYEKQQLITFQFQLGSGRYVKKVQSF